MEKMRDSLKISALKGKPHSALGTQIRMFVCSPGMGVKASKLRRIVGVRGSSIKHLRGAPQATTVPKGYIPISVGVNDETKRFMVHTTAFCDADFLDLLCRSADEYGFRNQGVLRIPYEAKAFEERMLKGLTSQHKDAQSDTQLVVPVAE